MGGIAPARGMMVGVMVRVVVVVVSWAHRAQMGVVGHGRDEWPAFLSGHSHNLNNLLHLVPLEWDRLLTVHLRLLPLEDRPEGQELGKDATDCPEINGRRVVVGTKNELGRTVPDGDNNLISTK